MTVCKDQQKCRALGGMQSIKHLLKTVPESKGWREKIKLTWEERRNPAKDEIFMSRRRSWAGERLTEEGLSQAMKEKEKEAINLAVWLSQAAHKKAHRENLGARERVDSAFSFHEIVQDFASRISRSRASTLESTEDASIVAIMSNEERFMEKFPNLAYALQDEIYETTNDDTRTRLDLNMSNQDTINDELICYILLADRNKIPNDTLYKEVTINDATDQQFQSQVPYHCLNTHKPPIHTCSSDFRDLPTISRRLSCPAFILCTFNDQPRQPIDTTSLLHSHTEFDRTTIYASDSISQHDFSPHHLPDDASEYSHMTGDSFHILDILRRHTDPRVLRKFQRCYEQALWRKEKSKVKARIKMERKWLRGTIEKDRLRLKWEEYEARIKEREEWKGKGGRMGFWGRLGGLWGIW